MMRRPLRLRSLLSTLLLFSVVSAPLAAQTIEQRTVIVPPDAAGGIQIPGPLGGPRQFKTGTGRIRGRVVSSESGSPIRRAQVRISGAEVASRAALTDAEGRYEFRDLPAGRITLTATKSGFVSVQYGQTRPYESGRPIELADKQSVDRADITMPRGSAINGRIVDEFGDPVPDVTVTAMRQSWSNGKRRLTPSGGRIAQTNDLGQFRIYGLPPGDYYVSAAMRGGLENAMFEMELMMAVQSVTSTGTPSTSAPKTGYASTYYPGTPNAAEAQKITVAAGQESANADFALVPVRLARVFGIVVGSDGRPLEGASVNVMPAARDAGLMLPPMTARTAKDGSFVLNSVAPGDYLLQVRTVQVVTSTQGDNVMMFRAMAMGGGDQESGSVPLAVGGEDIAGLVVATSKPGSAVGRVTFDGGPKPPSGGVRVNSMPVDNDGGGGLFMFAGATLKEDDTFELKGLTGPRLIRVAAPPGWTLKSVKLNGTDITDTGAEFKGGEATSGLEIELTNRTTTITGGVTTADGAVVKDYTVVIFADAPDAWRYPSTRWVTGTRPDQDGRFKVQHMPAGSYIAVAVDYVPQGEWGDPEILERLRDKGKRFSLDEAGTQTLELRLTTKY